VVQASGEAEPMPPPHTLLKLRPLLGILADALEFDLIDSGTYTAQEFVTWIQLQYLGRPNIGLGGGVVLRAHDVGVLRAVGPHR
jgi:hypothetical protein